MHRNSEHYPDPTFSGAYANIRRMEKAFCEGKKYIPWVYIASPYRGDVKTNTENAKRYSLFAVMQGKVLTFTSRSFLTMILKLSEKLA